LRYERKYRIEAVAAHLIRQGIRLHPAGFRSVYAVRQVNNIYFDTPSFNAYKDNVLGLAEREKYRVRWYGKDLLNIENAVLELKIKKQELGNKFSFEIGDFPFLDINSLIKKVNDFCPENLGLLRPTLFNCYQREYWETSGRSFRLTLDNNMQFAPLIPEPFVGRQVLNENNVSILELKYEEELDKQADRITQKIPYRRTKNSKYVSGIELCYR
jgi:hypothetical protein